MHFKAQQTMVTLCFILLLPLLVVSIPASFRDRGEALENIDLHTHKAFRNLQVEEDGDAEPDYDETEKPGCNNVSVQGTCTLVDAKKCCDIISISSMANYVCRTWESSCSLKLCPTRLYYAFVSDDEARAIRERKSEIEDVLLVF